MQFRDGTQKQKLSGLVRASASSLLSQIDMLWIRCSGRECLLHFPRLGKSYLYLCRAMHKIADLKDLEKRYGQKNICAMYNLGLKYGEY